MTCTKPGTHLDVAVACPNCGAVYCSRCCGHTNITMEVAERAMIFDPYMTCPKCSAEYYTAKKTEFSFGEVEAIEIDDSQGMSNYRVILRNGMKYVVGTKCIMFNADAIVFG